jgi:prevent-host-death family protein
MEAQMADRTVGLRELKTHLSEYMRQVKAGQTIVITEHGRPVGRLVPAPRTTEQQIQAMIDAGLAQWNGQHLPPVTWKRPRVRGPKTVADMLIEDRE